ncbi:Hypothetical protein OINT_2001861 [Brucella intermedia LMG 3301]|uniref:Uncharacterized protein n=1 Tax=Brucella intermedia LMG 3301 TaxID=641118 RepID=C4WQW1_9HYPH|nr:Hypothetical protein OINT_2001861 [Brucella intermedia LMG 3301]
MLTKRWPTRDDHCRQEESQSLLESWKWQNWPRIPTGGRAPEVDNLLRDQRSLFNWATRFLFGAFEGTVTLT